MNRYAKALELTQQAVSKLTDALGRLMLADESTAELRNNARDALLASARLQVEAGMLLFEEAMEEKGTA